MIVQLHAFLGWSGGRCLSLFLALVVLAPGAAEAHDTLGTCIQHAVHLTVGAKYIDLTIDLTFFEEWSERERTATDADGNGVISRSEQEDYLRKVGPQACKQVGLRVNGREVSLAPLYDPELDLLTTAKVGPAHHRLRLLLFATTPKNLRAGDEIVVEDRLWPEAKILPTAQAEGRDGCVLMSLPGADGAFVRPPAEGARLVRFNCLKPPLLGPAQSNAVPVDAAQAAGTVPGVIRQDNSSQNQSSP